MTAALYGPSGFYSHGDGPAAHFRTSPHQPVFAEAVLALLRSCGLMRVVDVGAGRGELLSTLHRLAPTLRLHGVEVVPRPAQLPAAIDWSAQPPVLDDALVIANEWLDTVPVDVVRSTADGPRTVLVAPDGAESFGPPPDAADRAWLDRWWPEPVLAEVGRSRDEAWAGLATASQHSLLVAIDYAHSLGSRPVTGSLGGYRRGRQVHPVPDGSCDITAHVALDACAAAAHQAGAEPGVLAEQRDVLAALGISAPMTTSRSVHDRLAAADRSTAVAELADPSGLGGFTWLIQPVGRPAPLLVAPGRRQAQPDLRRN